MSYKFTEEEGGILLRYARKTIMEKLGLNTSGDRFLHLEEQLKEECFKKKFGVFVTLHKNNDLRGCIGNLSGVESILENVKYYAINAAFRDSRFPELTPDEINDIVIEISILSEPQILEYSDSNDLLSKIRKDIDGLVIKKGFAKSTFLPQVWDQLPEKESFLSNLCTKAGLSKDEWKKSKLEIKTYQVQYFEEN